MTVRYKALIKQALALNEHMSECVGGGGEEGAHYDADLQELV